MSTLTSISTGRGESRHPPPDEYQPSQTAGKLRLFFPLTLQRIKKLIDDTIAEIDMFEAGGDADVEILKFSEETEFDYDDQNTEFFTTGKK